MFSRIGNRVAFLLVICACIIRCTVLAVSLGEETMFGNPDENVQVAQVQVQFSETSVKFQPGDKHNLTLKFSPPVRESASILFTYQSGDLVEYVQGKTIVKPLANLTVNANETSVVVEITGDKIGNIIVGLNSSSSQFASFEDTFVRVTVVHNLPLVTVNVVIGWIYFVAWSVSFYPQVILNFMRRSVVGLNFDFLALNITGFLAYGFFNVGLYWVDLVKDQYQALHPRGINPVQLNDVFFSLHAVLLTAVTIIQCFIFERGGQKMSKVGILLVVVAWLFALVMLFVKIGNVISWLTYLYYFSYIKLAVTLVKYIPQVYMNFKRKSTEGWSIGNVLLDFTGGAFSLLQMFLLAYNNDDWGSIFGDPTKFGLGVLSILFDIIFIVQHYILYRGTKPYTILNTDTAGTEKEV